MSFVGTTVKTQVQLLREDGHEKRNAKAKVILYRLGRVATMLYDHTDRADIARSLGVPDLLVGIRGVNLLVEVKNPASSGDKLTSDQIRWHLGWLGQVAVIRTAEQVAALVRGVLEGRK